MAERPEDLNLPNAVITRIIKDAIPDGVNVSKEARLAISKAASVFVLYATSCSNNFALKAKRKTISAQDVVSAMEDMEFDQFVKPLEECLAAYRKDQKGKKEQKKKEKEQSNTSKEEEDEVVIEDDDEDEGGGGDASVAATAEAEVQDVNGDDDDVVEISDDSSET